MKNSVIFFCAGLFTICYLSEAYSACLQQNLTQCLDSVCAINIGVNPAARCQLCGTASSGDEVAGKSGMTQLTLGTASKNTLTAMQLKSAPASPDERYTWAINECLKKIDGCNASDTQNYDGLIEQSCRAAGIEIQMTSAQENANVKKDGDTCKSEINSCVINGCGVGFTNCRDDSDFNRIFSSCSVAATGCAGFSAELRSTNINVRDTAVKNSDSLITSIAEGYKVARAAKIAAANADCTNNAAYDECVKLVCENNMRNKCAAGFSSEVSMANQLCKFHEIACESLR